MQRTVQDVMTREVVVAHLDTAFKEIADLFDRNDISAVPVVDEPTIRSASSPRPTSSAPRPANRMSPAAPRRAGSRRTAGSVPRARRPVP